MPVKSPKKAITEKAAKPVKKVVEKKAASKPAVTSANEYVNQLIGSADPIRVEGHSPETIASGEATEEQKTNIVDDLENTATDETYRMKDPHTGFGDALANGTQIIDPHPLVDLAAQQTASFESNIKIDDELTIQVINVEQEAEVLRRYDQLCATPSDINELLPYLRAVAEKCDHVTELGVRTPTSTYALLAGAPKQLVSYDIVRDPKVAEVEALAPNFKFVQGSSLEVDIEETDFLFIDTFHSATQLKLELQRHAGKVRKYIGMHDTCTYGRSSEPVYDGIPMHVRCGRGLLWAIEEFLAANPNWKVSFQTSINNGLTVLRRVS